MAYLYDNLRLEKGMYNEAGQSFTQVLEREDPSEHYKGTALEGLDAYQRQLKRFDIKVKGAGSDVVEKFFHTAQSAVLFPEYIARSVRQGMEEADLLPHITAAVTRFEGMDYRSITSVPEKTKRELRRVEEGAAIPQTEVKTQENLVKLHKRGRMLVASYEAIRYQKLDLFSVTLRQIGAHINRMHLEDAIDVMKVSSDPIDVVLVGGGAIVLPHELAGTAEVDAPEHAGCANAIGSAISKVSGVYEALVDYDVTPRDEALAAARAAAVEAAVEAGAVRDTVEIIDAEDVPLAYYPGHTNRVKVKAAGDLA